MLYVPQNVDFKAGDISAQFKNNWNRLEQCDNEAKAAGKIEGRYISEPFADGYAIYQIVKVNKKTVRIRVCTGLGDDWQIPYWGSEATIDRSYVELNIKRRDNLKKIFSKPATVRAK